MTILVPAATIAFWEGLLLLVGFFGLVCWKLATGEIALDDLFEGRSREPDGSYSSYASNGRVQSFLATMAVALYCLLRVVQDPHQFPDIPVQVVSILAASHAIYLGGKARAMLRGRLHNFLMGRTS
jgi:hypothetical protein